MRLGPDNEKGAKQNKGESISSQKAEFAFRWQTLKTFLFATGAAGNKLVRLSLKTSSGKSITYGESQETLTS